MLALDYDALTAELAHFLFPLARILALIASAPLLSHAGIPRRVKAALGIAVAAAVVPALPPTPPLDPFSVTGIIAFSREILIGLLLGFSVRLIVAAIEVAGELIGLQMGLGFATFFDPQRAGPSPALAMFLEYLTMLVWLAVGGPLMLFGAVDATFTSLPVGIGTLPAFELNAVARTAGTMFVAGLHLALPVIVALTIVNVALGFLARAAPQMNLFAVGFPMTLLTGIVALGVSLPLVLPFIERHLVASVELLLR